MASDLARSSRMGSAPSGLTRGLWQVPVFLLGLAAAFFVTVGRPIISSLTATSAESSARIARAALDVKPPDAQKALDAALIAAELKPDSGEAQFLLGSAYLALADIASESDAADYRARARKNLEQAHQLGVSEADAGRLTYRLGKAWLLLGVDPQQVVPALSKSIDQADDPFEAYGLLAQASLKKNPPDKAGAMEAVRQQLSRTSPTTDPKLVNQARLRMGEIALQLQNPREARAALNRVGADASPDVFLTARILLAKSHSESQEWTEASRQWEQIRGDVRLKPVERAMILFHLGACYQQEKRLQDAAQAWRDASAIGGAEGQAASLRLADLQATTDVPAAADSLVRGLAGPSDVANWKNPLIAIEELQSIIEHIIEQVKLKADLAAANKVAPLLVSVLGPGRPDEFVGATAESAAKQHLSKVGDDPTTAPDKIVKANDEFKEAAKSFALAASKVEAGPEQAEWLRRSGDCSIQAQDYPAALNALNRFAALETVIGEDRVSDAWYLIGETQQKLQNAEAARVAFQKCLKPTSPKRFFARYTLAMLELAEARQDDLKAADTKLDETERGSLALRARVKFDDAEQLLQANLTELRQALSLEPAALELSLFGHADAAYERKDYATAEQRLQGVLQQYPESLQAARARFRLGKCFWYQASLTSKARDDAKASPDEKQRLQRQLSEYLMRGAEQFGKVDELLSKKQQPLMSDDAVLQRLAGFAAAECWYFMGKYQDSLDRYLALAVRHKGQIAGLAALSQVWQCQRQLRFMDKAVDSLQQLRDELDQMPDGIFDGSSPIHNRAYWQNWLVQAGRQP